MSHPNNDEIILDTQNRAYSEWDALSSNLLYWIHLEATSGSSARQRLPRTVVKHSYPEPAFDKTPDSTVPAECISRNQHGNHLTWFCWVWLQSTHPQPHILQQHTLTSSQMVMMILLHYLAMLDVCGTSPILPDAADILWMLSSARMKAHSFTASHCNRVWLFSNACVIDAKVSSFTINGKEHTTQAKRAWKEEKSLRH